MLRQKQQKLRQGMLRQQQKLRQQGLLRRLVLPQQYRAISAEICYAPASDHRERSTWASLLVAQAPPTAACVFALHGASDPAFDQLVEQPRRRVIECERGGRAVSRSPCRGRGGAQADPYRTSGKADGWRTDYQATTLALLGDWPTTGTSAVDAIALPISAKSRVNLIVGRLNKDTVAPAQRLRLPVVDIITEYVLRPPRQ